MSDDWHTAAAFGERCPATHRGIGKRGLVPARSSGSRSHVLEQITHKARGAIIDVYTAWEWPALCEAVSCLKVDPDRLPGRIYDICVSENANPRL